MSTRLNLMAPEVRLNPYKFYAAMRQEAPVCEVEPGGVWAVSRYDDVAFVFKHPELFSSSGFRQFIDAPWLDYNPIMHTMFVMDPPEHTGMRALVSRAFGTRAVARLEQLLRGAADRLIKNMRERGSGEIYTDLAKPLPAVAIADLLGLDDSLCNRFSRWSKDLNNVRMDETDEAIIASTRATVVELNAHLREVVDARRRAPRDDLTSDLLQAEIQGVKLTEWQIIHFLILLLAGGFETPSNLLATTISNLLDYPDVLARVRADPSLITAFIDEALRFSAPAHALARIAVQDVKLGDVTVGAGSVVLTLLASANRDETYFTRPDRFDIDRRERSHLSFGYGIHFCLGAALTKLTARIAFETLFSTFRGFAARAPIQWHHTIFLHHPKAVELEYIPA
jgi:cytochrome P450